MRGKRYEIRFSGAGGQGVILAAVLLAEAAGIYDGKYVCQSQSYGPEARGGSSKADVIISDSPIDYPKAMKLDLLVAMNQASCDAFMEDLKPRALIIVDSRRVQNIPAARVVALPFTEIAQEETGSALSANMVALGAAAVLSRAVTPRSVELALAGRAPKGTRHINQKALRAGMRAARKVDVGRIKGGEVSEQEEV